MTRSLTYVEALREGMRQEMERDETVFVMGEGVGLRGSAFKQTAGFYDQFGPERVRDTAISELAIAGAAVGAAISGMRPIADLMWIDFTTLACDQICNQAAKLHYVSNGQITVPAVFRATTGHLRGQAAQHCGSWYAFYCNMPGLKVVVPSTPYNAKGLMSAAVRDDDPVIYFVHKVLLDTSGPVPEDNYVIPLGKAEIARQGSDATVVAIGRMRVFAEEAAATLADGGIDVEVVDPQSLSPLDEGTILESVKKTHRLVVVDEDTPRCSVASDIVSLAARQAFDYLDAPPQVVVPDHAQEHVHGPRRGRFNRRDSLVHVERQIRHPHQHCYPPDTGGINATVAPGGTGSSSVAYTSSTATISVGTNRA